MPVPPFKKIVFGDPNYIDSKLYVIRDPQCFICEHFSHIRAYKACVTRIRRCSTSCVAALFYFLVFLTSITISTTRLMMQPTNIAKTASKDIKTPRASTIRTAPAKSDSFISTARARTSTWRPRKPWVEKDRRAALNASAKKDMTALKHIIWMVELRRSDRIKA